jgi:hypothetical protein
MRIFISWSGEPSRRVAEALRKYLPLMLQGIEAFMSKHDLESGTRWSLELAKELESSRFGVLCLTPDNLESSWMLFEAGALTKHVEGRAAGLLIGGLKPTDVSGPLSQFQHRSFTRGEIQALLRDINAASVKPLEPAQLGLIFEKWWPDIESAYEVAIKGASETSKRQPRDQRELIEEILTRIRVIETVIDRKSMVITMGELLDRSLAGLTRRQRDLLVRLAQFGEDEATRPRDIEREDLDALKRTELILETADGPVIVHKLIADALLMRTNL